MSFPRDVMVNTAVTIVPRANHIDVIGEKDTEVCQYAFELTAKKLPWPEKQLRMALTEQMEMVLKKMWAAGMVRP
jgi:hypothetical protein